MATKTKPAQAMHTCVSSYIYNGNRSDYYYDWTNGGETISYADGRRLPNRHWPWKECHHESVNRWTNGGIAGTSICEQYRPRGRITIRDEGTCIFPGRYTPSLPPRPAGGFDRSVLTGILNQIDLNKGESVLLYSGILQAIPLLGGVFKLNRILKDAARHLSKSFRKKPFVTVVKQLISLDFIDRFVISPTIDDARKFADATNYVLNVIQTARERSSHQFALSSELTNVSSDSETSWSNYNLAGVSTFAGTAHARAYETSKAFALLEAKYDIDSVGPLKLWARRVGLTRPLESAWDLVPFSFIIDYFTRAGDFISALSDEMSDVEGLRGRITRIHDLWGCYTSCSQVTMSATSVRMRNLMNPEFHWTIPATCNPQATTYGTKIFDRFRIGNPYTALLSQQEKIGDYLTINFDLSTTRKRTIAELIIQAKL